LIPLQFSGLRTHLSLTKDAPVPRAIQKIGRVVPRPILIADGRIEIGHFVAGHFAVVGLSCPISSNLKPCYRGSVPNP
jgi:hypothetical protein